MCNEWRFSFVAFRDWAMQNGYADHLEIDRIDNDGNYEPGNCRWVTKSVNNQNHPYPIGISGYRGVAPSHGGHKWMAMYTHCNKRKYIGSFSTREDAARAYDARVREIFGEDASTNFPKE